MAWQRCDDSSVVRTYMWCCWIDHLLATWSPITQLPESWPRLPQPVEIKGATYLYMCVMMGRAYLTDHGRTIELRRDDNTTDGTSTLTVVTSWCSSMYLDEEKKKEAQMW